MIIKILRIGRRLFARVTLRFIVRIKMHVYVYLQTAYPLRIHQIHVINMPSYAQSAFNVVVGLLKKKLANRVSTPLSAEGYNSLLIG